MASEPPKVFVSYNRADRDWTEWIGESCMANLSVQHCILKKFFNYKVALRCRSLAWELPWLLAAGEFLEQLPKLTDDEKPQLWKHTQSVVGGGGGRMARNSSRNSMHAFAL
jgi:hypothetical protein